MPDIKHHFRSGRMNKDLDERLVPNGEYRDAQNIEIITSEGSGVGSVQNVLGNTLKDGRTYDDVLKEFDEFSQGSNKIAKKITESTKNKSLTSIAGGGDTVAAINKFKCFSWKIKIKKSLILTPIT